MASASVVLMNFLVRRGKCRSEFSRRDTESARRDTESAHLFSAARFAPAQNLARLQLSKLNRVKLTTLIIPSVSSPWWWSVISSPLEQPVGILFVFQILIITQPTDRSLYTDRSHCTRALLVFLISV